MCISKQSKPDFNARLADFLKSFFIFFISLIFNSFGTGQFLSLRIADGAKVNHPPFFLSRDLFDFIHGNSDEPFLPE
jgi:hypothetical protein